MLSKDDRKIFDVDPNRFGMENDGDALKDYAKKITVVLHYAVLNNDLDAVEDVVSIVPRAIVHNAELQAYYEPVSYYLGYLSGMTTFARHYLLAQRKLRNETSRTEGNQNEP